MEKLFLLQSNAIPVIVLAVFAAVIAFFILSKTDAGPSNRYFVLFLGCLVGWLGSSCVSVNAADQPTATFILRHIQLTLAACTVMVLNRFMKYFPSSVPSRSITITRLLVDIYSVAVILASVTGGRLVPGVERILTVNGTYGIHYPAASVRTLMLGYFALALASFVFTTVIKIRKTDGRERTVLKNISYGLIAFFSAGIVISIILPAAGVPQYSFISYYAVILFIVFTAYSVINYHLLRLSLSLKINMILLTIALVSFVFYSHIGGGTLWGKYDFKNAAVARLLTEHAGGGLPGADALIRADIPFVKKVASGPLPADGTAILGTSYYHTVHVPAGNGYLQYYFPAGPYRTELHGYIITSVLVLIGFIGLIFLVSPVLWRVGIVDAIDKLIAGSRKVSTGDYGFQLDIATQDEFGQLAESFNKMIRDVNATNHKLKETQVDTVLRLGIAAEFRDKETSNHLKRVNMYSNIIARELGFDAERIDLLMSAMPMHDVGKLGIPDGILLKPGRLTPQEFEEMKKHTTIGGKILAGSDSPLIKLSETIALMHHEKWDGSGYPHGIGGEDIPLEGRIAAVVDVYDALSSKRCYKDAMAEDEVMAILKEGHGRHFDPRLLDIFFDHHDEVMAIKEQFRDN